MKSWLFIDNLDDGNATPYNFYIFYIMDAKQLLILIEKIHNISIETNFGTKQYLLNLPIIYELIC
jgi:hypothetical protein